MEDQVAPAATSARPRRPPITLIRRRTPTPTRARSTCLSSSARPCHTTHTSACASRQMWFVHCTPERHPHHLIPSHPSQPSTLTPPTQRRPTLTFTSTVSPSSHHQNVLTLLTSRASYGDVTLDQLKAIPQATTSARSLENPFAGRSSSLIGSSPDRLLAALRAVPPAEVTSQKQVS